LDIHPAITHYYNFESSNVQGTLVRNLAVNRFDASLINDAKISSTEGSYIVGRSALNLVSTGSYSTSPYFSINGIMLGNAGLTFALWFKTSSTGSWARLFDFGNGQDQQNIVMSSSRDSSSKLGYYIKPGTNILSDITASDGTWRHLVFTVGTNGTYKLYMNGQLARVDTNMQVPEYIFRSNAWIGKSQWSTGVPYNGQIDELRIYNTVLDPNDVLELYAYAVPGINALTKCTSLTSIAIPTSIAYIGSFALASTGLTSLTIPTSVKSVGIKSLLLLLLLLLLLSLLISFYIGINFVAGCNNLTSIVAPSSLSLLSSLSGCQRLIEDLTYNVSGMKRYTLQTLTSVTVATGTISISIARYFGCPISTITIPTTVTSIQLYAFQLSRLSSIVIPSSVTSIAISAFESCEQLISVTIPTSVISIGINISSLS